VPALATGVPHLAEPSRKIIMDHADLARVLTALGCPADKSLAMAAQLDKRAHQLAAEQSQTYEAALRHLLGLMRQGWAAPKNLPPLD